MNYLHITHKWLTWLFFLIILVACKKDQEELEPIPRNSSEVIMGNKPWNYITSKGIKISTRIFSNSCWVEKLSESYKNFFGISFYRYYDDNFNGRNNFETLYFSAIPLRIGSYELTGSMINICRPDTIPAGAFYTSEYDAGKDNYRVLQSEKNYFRVTKVDKQTGLVEGEFMASFIKTFGAKDSTYPDTIRFQPSRFSAFLGAEE